MGTDQIHTDQIMKPQIHPFQNKFTKQREKTGTDLQKRLLCDKSVKNEENSHEDERA